MGTDARDRVLKLIQKAIGELDSSELQATLQQGMVVPSSQTRTYQAEHGDREGILWIFFPIPEHNVALAYSEDGYGLEGLPWGLIFLRSSEYGSSGSWYQTLQGLVMDSGYFEPM